VTEPSPLPTLTYEGQDALGRRVSSTTNIETARQLVTRLYGGRWRWLRVWRLDDGTPVGGIDRVKLRRGRAYWYDVEGGEEDVRQRRK